MFTLLSDLSASTESSRGRETIISYALAQTYIQHGFKPFPGYVRFNRMNPNKWQFLVKKDDFRSDLVYRLSQVTLDFVLGS